jgi:hypothetical protein
VKLEELATGRDIAGGIGGSLVVHGVKGPVTGFLERWERASS